MNFFFDNPFLAIILIAVISSFFKKKKENPAQNHNRPKQAGKDRPRPLNPFEEARELFEELSRPASEQTRPIPRKTVKKKVQRQANRGAETAAGSLERTEPTSMGLQDSVPDTTQAANPPAALMPDTTPKMKLEASENHIIDAVIWSEILGPPRAKKSYRRNHFRS